MRKTFNYWFQSTANGFIDIEDTGNVCLSALGARSITEFGRYFLIIKTNDVGITKVLSYGPVHALEEDEEPLSRCSCSYKRMEYNTYKVNKEIQAFIRDINPTAMEEVSFEDIKDKLINLADLIV